MRRGRPRGEDSTGTCHGSLEKAEDRKTPPNTTLINLADWHLMLRSRVLVSVISLQIRNSPIDSYRARNNLVEIGTYGS